MYDETVPVFTRSLNALAGIIDRAEAHATARKIDPAALLTFRLYPDMWDFSRQVQAATDHARRSVTRLSGQEPQSIPDSEPGFSALRERIAASLASVGAADRATLNAAAGRTIRFPVGTKQMELSAEDYVRGFILPNFYFHLTTAYVMLRHNGVELTKTDFVGKI